MLKKIYFALFSSVICFGLCFGAYAEDVVVEEVLEESVIKSADEISAEALDAYDVEGSLFQKITDLEQEKLVMQLEADRMKLDIEVDRLSKEKLKLQQELNEMGDSGVQNIDNIEIIRAEIDAQTELLKKQIEELQRKQESYKEDEPVRSYSAEPVQESKLTGKYKLINIVGVGNQLQATIEDTSTGQNKRIAVGKNLDGYTIKSISLNEGIVLEKDGVLESLNVGK